MDPAASSTMRATSAYSTYTPARYCDLQYTFNHLLTYHILAVLNVLTTILKLCVCF